MKNEESESNLNSNDILNNVFFFKYKCIKKLGEGSFGMVYKAEYNKEYFALKFEDKRSNSNLLESEAAIMKYLRGPNIPFIKSFGFSGDYNILVMQLLGKSLEDLFKQRRRFSLKTICQLAFQMINVLEFIHNHHIIHRDMKPDNFLMGLDDLSHFLYLIDFGLAKKYRSSKTLIQYPMVEKKKLTGTARYASRNALRGLEQSRRDDLEGAGYVLLYLLRGSLPWQGLQAKNKEDRYRKILEIKNSTSTMELCNGYPEELADYIDYTKRLEYEEEPNYDMCRNLFLTILNKERQRFDYIYDWTTKEELRSRKDFTLKTDVDSFGHLNKPVKLASMKKRQTYREEEGENEDEGENLQKTNREVIYRTTKGQERIPTTVTPEKEKKDKDESKCCRIF